MFRRKPIAESAWIELVLALFVLFLTIWFVVFSIGWVRYAYGGFVVGLFLSGRFIWDIVNWAGFKIGVPSFAYIGLMVCVAIGINLYIIHNGAVADDANQTAEFIATSIPKDAIIETWEWELDMLSEHRQFHHPQQELLFQAIRESSKRRPFSLSYDILQANPDYLIIGTFGNWTKIYPEDVVKRYFTLVSEFGIYHIYKRIG
jgi:hypothetical protein